MLGGVPGKVLADRMGCLKGGVVANVVVPTAQYVRFAAHSLLTELAALFPNSQGRFRERWLGLTSCSTTG